MKARAVIVGGGVIGLGLAYQLALRGFTDVVLCEKSNLCSGASARNGGGVRTQWATAGNIELMLESLRHFENFSTDLGINIWFRQGGYLFIAKNSAHSKALAKNVKLQNEHGVGSRMVSPLDIKQMAPHINIKDVTSGAFNQKDGVLFPFPVLWGYAGAAREMGVKIQTHTTVKDIKTRKGKITKVITDKGEIETSMVINAAAAWAPEIGKMVGVKLPNKPEKHEAVVTEPLRPFLTPNLVPMDSGMYVAQTMRGEFCACAAHESGKVDYDAVIGFIRKVSKLITHLIPRLGHVKILRHWAGYYDITPDTNPILGPCKEVEGFLQIHGFMGHGFMMAPVMTRIMADFIAKEKTHSIIEKCNPDRFKGRLLEPETMIIG